MGNEKLNKVYFGAVVRQRCDVCKNKFVAMKYPQLY